MTAQAPEWMAPELWNLAKARVPEAEPVGDPFRAIAYEEGDHTDWQVSLEAGKCYIFTGVGDQTVEEMYLGLFDLEDEDVAEEKESPARVAIEWCAQVPGVYKLRGEVSEGHGHYNVGVFVNPRGAGISPGPTPAPVEPPPEQPDPVAAKDLEKVIKDMAKSEAAGAEQIGDFFGGSADKTDWYTALDKSKCYWFIGAGDDSISSLHLYLWDPSDKRITANKSETNTVSVGHCPDTSGMFHFQAKVDAGEGNYKVGVFAKKK